MPLRAVRALPKCGRMALSDDEDFEEEDAGEEEADAPAKRRKKGASRRSTARSAGSAAGNANSCRKRGGVSALITPVADVS